MTVCYECVSFKNLEPSSPRKDVWYNHLCLANPLPTEIDPVDGEEKPCTINDLGRKVFVDNRYKYCRDCNDGNCPQFISMIELPIM